MKLLNILVFPCGSEIGLEIHRSLKYSAHVNLFGASSVDDHGKFVYETYVGGLPFIDEGGIIPALKNIVEQYHIDAIYPAMDSVICRLKNSEAELGCKVITSCDETAAICLSKTKTYNKLKGLLPIPEVFGSLQDVKEYPVFIKPEIGYGTRGTYKAETAEEANCFLRRFDFKGHIITEYLPGEEFTVDCFTNRNGKLLFVGPRKRNRIMNGISVNTNPVKDGLKEFMDLAAKLNDSMKFRGAWFFQLKKNKYGELILMEIASRLGGASALYRGLGVNFALLSIYDAFDIDVKIAANNYHLELDRALDNRFKTNLVYTTVYVDLDDCLVVHDKVNTEMVEYLYHVINRKIKVVLLTKHDGDLNESLRQYRLTGLFDEVFHIKKEDKKYTFIKDKTGILIDDSFAERKEAAEMLKISVFSPDMIEVLFVK